jgi:exonuclease VII small subunit
MRRAHRNPGVAYGKALEQLLMAERKLARAFNAWDRARRAVSRADKRLNKAEADDE